jgi:asparagine synthase (glutamine-hydrolysing)
MCGLAGFYSFNISSDNAHQVLSDMGSAIIHRGPDDSGTWFEKSAGIGFSHRRLAIVDLSPAGHQPMVSSSGRFVIAFNGEIYNHMALRTEIEKQTTCQWKGHSDTETLLMAFEVFGIEQTIEKAIGMFALAIWDNQDKYLYLIRDRLGEKPLYYGWQKDALLFGSELSSLKKHPNFNAEINRDALSLFIRQGYINAPHSIYENVFKLEPGTILRFACDSKTPEKTVYWSAKKNMLLGANNPFVGDSNAVVNELERQLGNAVERQMMADVPLGAFLSGGVDSSAIVALMQTRSNKKVKTFSIGFHEKGYNEAEFAKAVAKHIGTEHTECYVSSTDALNVIPNLATMYSEPFADSSQIPTFLVSKMAKEHVTVSLSGDGGDELFSGYGRYKKTASAWNKVNTLPYGIRGPLAKGLKAVPTTTWDKLCFGLQKNIGDKIHKGAETLNAKSFEQFYINYLMSHTRSPNSLVLNGNEPTIFDFKNSEISQQGLLEQMAFMDTHAYLPDDILCKVDRAAMNVSLETRVPLLDHNVVEFSATIPMAIKTLHGDAKWPLKQVLFNHVPRELIERPKKGFGIPLEKWLREELKDWAESLLNENKLYQQGYLNSYLVRKYWSEHLSGKRNWSYLLWNILMFQAWLEAQ